jgi:DNA-binding MarR family transcriptional regulator
MAQVEILQRLAEEPGARVNELAVRHKLAKNTVSLLVQQLVNAELVDRVPDRADRRAVRLTLTSAGERTLSQWQQAHERRLETALGGLTGPARAAIAAALPALQDLVAELEKSAGELPSA